METNNYPNWLVSIEQAKKLKGIGFDNLEIFVDKSGNWYRGTEIYDFDIDGEIITYSVKETYLNGDNDFIPTYTFEQVLEWFREKGLVGIILTNEILNEGDPLYFPIVDDLDGDYYTLDNYYTYEEAREALVNKLIEVYKKE